MRFEQLQSDVLNWAKDKGILDNSKPMKQGLKTLEEVNELLLAIDNKDKPEIEDAFGDILVTVIIGCELCGLDAVKSLQLAYDTIKGRTGKMENGIFIKDKP